MTNGNDETVPSDSSDDEDEPISGVRVVAGRYKLLRHIGGGGNGEVWEAHDSVSDTKVALKLLRDGLGAEPARVRREVSALRLLRLPGVVRLLDEGVDGHQVFLVMELVEGAPFPGSGKPRTWEALADLTVALLETLARVHAAGVVHRDLKPDNVLVSEAGFPTVLDFGLSYGDRLGKGVTGEFTVVGTPLYMAPEQVVGEPITPKVDLYAAGLMLYQALSGTVPHDTPARGRLMLARATRPAPPLSSQAPHVPPRVASVVDMMLARNPDQRPRSAADALGMLLGETFVDRTAQALPRIDGGAPVQALLARVRAGRCVDVVGPRGTGRSRCLREAFESLEREGRRVCWARPARQPFESIEELIGPLPETRSLSLRDLAALVDQRLQALLESGLVVLADDVERLDPWSAAALQRGRPGGAVVRALVSVESGASAEAQSEGPSVVRLDPLSEEALQALFAGRERIFHLRSDAASVLWLRTGGLQTRIAQEVTAWVRAGLARWDGERLAMDHDALDRLEAGLRVATRSAVSDPSSTGVAGVEMSAHAEQLCGWLDLAWPSTQPDLLAQVMGLPLWRVEATIEELVQRGAARLLRDGRVELSTAVRVDDERSPEQRRAAHRAIAAALPEGADGRLRHLLAAESDASSVSREAEALALRLAREGRMGRAIAALDEGLFAVRRAGVEAVDEERLLTAWVEIVIPIGGPQARDRVLFEICRAITRTEKIERVEELVRASLAFHAGGERALQLVDELSPFEDLRLERARQGVRAQAARWCSIETEQAVVDQVAAWGRSVGDTLMSARAAGWLGRLRYRQGRFDEAAAMHAQAQVGETWEAASINALLNEASALLEAFRFEEAGEKANLALTQAAARRHAFFEARACWLVRTVDYRMGRAISLDREFIEAVAEIGVRDFEAQACVTEAAIAYRMGDLRSAAEIAERAHRLAASIGDLWPGLLARALALAGGAERSAQDEIETLGERALQCPVLGLGIQMLGLLVRAKGMAPSSWRDGAASLVEGIPERFRSLRMDVLSADEALASLRVPQRRAG